MGVLGCPGGWPSEIQACGPFVEGVDDAVVRLGGVLASGPVPSGRPAQSAETATEAPTTDVGDAKLFAAAGDEVADAIDQTQPERQNLACHGGSRGTGVRASASGLLGEPDLLPQDIE